MEKFGVARVKVRDPGFVTLRERSWPRAPLVDASCSTEEEMRRGRSLGLCGGARAAGRAGTWTLLRTLCQAAVTTRRELDPARFR